MTDVPLTGSMGNTARTAGQGWRVVEALNFQRKALREIVAELSADKCLPANDGTAQGCILAIDAAPADIQTGSAVLIRSGGRLYDIAIVAAIDMRCNSTP